jgi:hypothetical protein
MLARSALRTPDVTDLPQVQLLTSTSMDVVNATFVLAFLTAGILVMSHGTLQVRYGVGELAPRLVAAFAAANLSPFLVSQIIGLANGLTQTLTGDGIDARGSLGTLHDTVTFSLQTGADALLSVALTGVVGVLAAGLMVTWLVRLAVLVVLAAVAPLALACHALPFTDGAARLWWRSLIGCVGTVTAQAVLLHAGLSVFLSGPSRADLGLDAADAPSMNLFIVVCLLGATVSVPGLMRRFATSGGGRRGSTLVRVLVTQQITRALRRGSGPRPAGAPAAPTRPLPARPPAARALPAVPAVRIPR